jgi:hypothetical protein
VLVVLQVVAYNAASDAAVPGREFLMESAGTPHPVAYLVTTTGWVGQQQQDTACIIVIVATTSSVTHITTPTHKHTRYTRLIQRTVT